MQPPELAGRADILHAATVAIGRMANQKSAQGIVLTGLRGVGKTVLLNRIQGIAEQQEFEVDLIEAPESKRLVELLFPSIKKAVLRMSRIERASSYWEKALRVLKSLQISAKVADTEFTVGLHPEPGIADSGDLERDLADLLQSVGELAKATGKGFALLIDELQYLTADDYSALLVALHRTSQRGLPVFFAGAGLPTLPGLSGNAKSYSERLLTYPRIGPLTPEEGKIAIEEPARNLGISYEPDALELILTRTQCYPYFLQEWGYASWNAAQGSIIKKADVTAASGIVIRKLDESFFRVRLERLSKGEKKYLRVLAQLGSGAQATKELSKLFNKKLSSLGPTREKLIQKGMIFQPKYGYQEFTVPLFDEFMQREMPLDLENT